MIIFGPIAQVVSCTEQSLTVFAAYRVSCRDSGKTAVDAALGEVMVTCEKIWWLLKNGQKWLKPDYRSAGIMVLFHFSTSHFIAL